VKTKRREWNRREWKRRKESEREKSGKEEKRLKEKRMEKREDCGREENRMEEMTSVTRTVVAPCALDTCQSSLHVLVTVCAVRGVRRSTEGMAATLECWALEGCHEASY